MSDQLPDPSTEAEVDNARRGFMQSALLAAGATQLPVHAAAAAATPGPAPAPMAPARPLTLNINGTDHQLSLEPRVTLLDALRESIGLTGTKKGCDRGQCGACTVLVDGRRVNACLTLAIMHRGAKITTIEGIAQGEQLAPIQAAFIEHDAFQCGYCTPGQICSAVACIAEMRAGTASAVSPNVREQAIAFTDPEIRERMSGNLCRCGAYNNIVAAIRATAKA
ncbi:2Fe-2S iron-sulfur cluster-binding protein [Massilia forsythiae]|nr:2Fe-2S iron-sulfur cluster-binding protein [Massilia forsythiae]